MNIRKLIFGLLFAQVAVVSAEVCKDPKAIANEVITALKQLPLEAKLATLAITERDLAQAKVANTDATRQVIRDLAKQEPVSNSSSYLSKLQELANNPMVRGALGSLLGGGN